MKTSISREEILQYAEQWICFNLDSTRIVGHGTTPEEAQDMAHRAGEEHAFLYYVRDFRPPNVFI